MAENTDINLRSKCIYSLYVRNHGEDGTFKGIINDLDRIKDLGVDIIWLLPIYPIGVVNRKGKLGCPYSILDHRSINPEYGTIEDFKLLIEEVHKRNMHLIIDIVFNHTSYESVLYKEHKNWFYRDKYGHAASRIDGWTDIIDLDYSSRDLWDYQIETLKYWTLIGVDGFRCDVALLVPVEFWKTARYEIEKLKSGMIWLAESIDPYFIKYLRRNNIPAHSDSELYEAFDITYDYDTFKYLLEYLKGERSLEDYMEKKRAQEAIYPENYVKLRFLENHDTERAASLIISDESLYNWTAFFFFEKGAALLYDGQEIKCLKNPNLFDRDPVEWNYDLKFVDFIKRLIQIKKDDIFVNGYYEIFNLKKNGVIEARYTLDNKSRIGIFNVEGRIGEYHTGINDGIYKNIIDGKEISIINGNIKLQPYPIIMDIQ